MKFKEYIKENYKGSDHNLIQQKKKQKGLEYKGWNHYTDKQGNSYQWDEKVKDFRKNEEKKVNKINLNKVIRNPIKEGYNAFYQRKDLKDNPYEKGSSYFNEWKIGWNKAQDEASEDWANEQVRKNK